MYTYVYIHTYTLHYATFFLSLGMNFLCIQPFVLDSLFS